MYTHGVIKDGIYNKSFMVQSETGTAQRDQISDVEKTFINFIGFLDLMRMSGQL